MSITSEPDVALLVLNQNLEVVKVGHSKLKPNPSKMETLLMGGSCIRKHTIQPVVDGVMCLLKYHVHSLIILLDLCLTLGSQVASVPRSTFF